MLERLNILCVEDDPAEREVLLSYAEILSRQLQIASTYAEGLAKATSTRFGVTVKNQDLPDATGLHLVKVIRAASGPNCSKPVEHLDAPGKHPEIEQCNWDRMRDGEAHDSVQL